MLSQTLELFCKKSKYQKMSKNGGAYNWISHSTNEII